MNTSGGVEGGSFLSIYQDGDTGTRNAGHYEAGEIGREVEKDKGFLMKDHFSLSKDFSRSIFRIILPFLPFIFKK